MNEKKNIDRLFQEKFKDFEVAPPEFVWENIQEALQEKKKRRAVPLWIRLSGVAAILALGSLLSIPYFNGTENSDTPVVIDNAGQQNTPLQANPEGNVPNTDTPAGSTANGSNPANSAVAVQEEASRPQGKGTGSNTSPGIAAPAARHLTEQNNTVAHSDRNTTGNGAATGSQKRNAVNRDPHQAASVAQNDHMAKASTLPSQPAQGSDTKIGRAHV